MSILHEHMRRPRFCRWFDGDLDFRWASSGIRAAEPATKSGACKSPCAGGWGERKGEAGGKWKGGWSYISFLHFRSRGPVAATPNLSFLSLLSTCRTVSWYPWTTRHRWARIQNPLARALLALPLGLGEMGGYTGQGKAGQEGGKSGSTH